MKKLLILLLCVPLIFTTCKKEDDTPSANNNNANTTFLSKNDGTVWYSSASSTTMTHPNVMFQNDNVFMISKGPWNGNTYDCLDWSQSVYNIDNAENSLKIYNVSDNLGGFVTYTYTIDSLDSDRINMQYTGNSFTYQFMKANSLGCN